MAKSNRCEYQSNRSGEIELTAVSYFMRDTAVKEYLGKLGIIQNKSRQMMSKACKALDEADALVHLKKLAQHPVYSNWWKMSFLDTPTWTSIKNNDIDKIVLQTMLRDCAHYAALPEFATTGAAPLVNFIVKGINRAFELAPVSLYPHYIN